jgi:hypothetical protein
MPIPMPVLSPADRPSTVRLLRAHWARSSSSVFFLVLFVPGSRLGGASLQAEEEIPQGIAY